MANNKEASIIIKKIKKGGHAGHHGGAWKVAYADFVTAMMAFFLLLWLLQATAQSQKEGIAEYFTPTIGVRDAAGIGFKGGKTSYDEGRKVAEKSPPGIIVGRMPAGPVAQKQEKQSPVESTQDSYLFERGEKAIKQAMEEDPNFHDFKDNVIVEQLPEGLKIELIDDDKLPMFEPKGAQLTQAGEKILRLMSNVIKQMPNRVSITGHTEATNYMENGTYSNWELTADRANAARRFLMTTNLEPTRVAKVTGRADQELLDPKFPTAPRNRRVTLILMRESYLKTLDSQTPAPSNLLTVPRPATVEKPEPKPKAAAKPASKPAYKPEKIPDTKVERTNVNGNAADFKMPDTLKTTLNGGKPVQSNEDILPSDILSPSKVTNATGSVKPKAADVSPAAAVAKPSGSAAPANDNNGNVEVPVKRRDDLDTPEFKLPDSLRRSIEGTSGNAKTPSGTDAPQGGAANGGLNSLPSGLIHTDEQ
jgi:chemotaxis protein MotB